MNTVKLQINVGLQIQKPVAEVFEAIVNPAHMSQYFISTSTGRMEEGKTLVWRFPEFKDDAPVRIGKVVADEFISFYWEIGDKELLVEMHLEPMPDGSTVVKITEGPMENNQAGINWLKGNTEGWANFLCCLKAYAEHGINIRKGGFDFRSDIEQ